LTALHSVPEVDSAIGALAEFDAIAPGVLARQPPLKELEDRAQTALPDANAAT
jgi:hypothetical protein